MTTAATAPRTYSPPPVPWTTFVGREELAESIGATLQASGTRLLTLVGPGGVGKTRLAIRVTTDVDAAFTDGMAFVDLTSIASTDLVAPAIAGALALTEPGEGIVERIIAALRDRDLLLVLDNFEHVSEAAPLIARLLAGCPRLRVLTTSREPLRLAAERLVPVPPLAVPPESLPVEELAEVEAVALFRARAEAAGAVLPTAPSDLAVLAAIVRRLDGLPLAIELAAARLVHLTPNALLDRLERRLPLLASRSRDAPARQRTMRDAISWSYDLLTPDEQALFRRLGVFAGGFSLDAAVAVGAAFADAEAEAETFELLAGLVDRSIVQRRPDLAGEPRFGLLETIREFALETLTAMDERATAERAHARHFLEMAERAGTEMRGPAQAGWIARLDVENGNLRAALQLAIDTGEPETALRTAIGLSTFWSINSRQREGLDWLNRALALPADPALDERRGAAFRCGAALAWALGDYPRATELGERSLAIARAIGNQSTIAGALNNLGVIAGRTGDHARASALFEQGLTAARDANDPYLIGAALANLGLEATERGDHRAAVSHFEEGLSAFRAMNDEHRSSQTLANIALATHRLGELERSKTLFEEALAIQRALGDDRSVAITLEDMSGLLLELGETGGAASHLAESALLSIRVGNPGMAASALCRLAHVEGSRGRPEWSAWLLGAVDALRAGSAEPLPEDVAVLAEETAATALTRLGEVRFQVTRSGAGGLSPEQITAQLLAGAAPVAEGGAATRAPTETVLAEGLTEREAQVLCLLVEGRTDRDIAAALFVSPKTVSNHVANILAKLQVETRTAAAAFALRHGLV